VLGLILERGPC